MSRIVTLWDGRRGYFYTSRLAGNPIFQPVDDDGCAVGDPELADADDHRLSDEDAIAGRLEYLRGEIRAERISWGELAELQSLASHIEPGDIELLEAAGVPEIVAHVPATVRAYIECALWASVDDDGEPLDRSYGADDIEPGTIASMSGDVAAFLGAIESAGVDRSEWSDDQLGHDLWLTRNGHGAGFWDRGHGEPGDALTELAHALGESRLYVGDDGRLYVP